MLLEDLVPQPATFKLRLVPDREFRINPVTLADEIWLRQTFGAELSAIFSEIRIEPICRIVFRLMPEEDREFFAKREVKITNEEGDVATTVMGGVALLRALISGVDEKLSIFNAFMTTLGLSRPVVDKLVAEAEATEKKSLTTGEKFSISSPMSTDGAMSTYSPELLAKYASG